ncbi:MAG TPA: Dabb family protein [Peptostreptococcaceae bacterium]|jgi:hypothetical protein|nr:Dabb family protein [Peptostreptococcaceae bacterium]
MIKHIVFFKFDNNEDAKEVKKRLLDMDGKIDVLKYIEVGENFFESERNYDLCLITHFNNKEDLNIYADHPVHVLVKQYIGTVAKSSAVVDYEI